MEAYRKKPILLKDNSNRFVNESYTKQQLKKWIMKHKKNIKNLLKYLSNELLYRAKIHDHTKIETIDLQYEYSRKYYGKNITKYHTDKDNKAFNYHVENERHHLQTYIPKDVNLIDILEMICDCVCASKERSKQFFPINIDTKTLKLAFDNTTQMMLELTKLK